MIIKICYLFNVIDCYTKWLGYVFDTSAVKENAIQSVNILVKNNDLNNLILRVDNGSQYRSNSFRESMSMLGITVEFIHNNTPEENGHIESFHKTLKSIHG